MKEACLKIFISTVIASIVLLFVVPLSCKLTPEGIKIISGDYKSPVIESFSVCNEEAVKIVFSKDVEIKRFGITPFVETENCNIKKECGFDGVCIVDMKFPQEFEAGMRYVFYGEVKDRIGNSLTFSMPFLGYNGTVPELEITEVHPANGKYSSGGKSVLLTEYVELTVKSEGNLAGIKIVSGYDGDEKSFLLPAVKVFPGEIILVHLRTNEEGAVSETEDNLSASTASFSKPSVRDLWCEENVARLGDKIDVIAVINSNDDSILDAMCYAGSTNLEWTKNYMTELMEMAVENGKWNSISVEDAVLSDGITATKCFVKRNPGNNASCWQIENCRDNAASLENN